MGSHPRQPAGGDAAVRGDAPHVASGASASSRPGADTGAAWQAHVVEALTSRHGDRRGRQLAERYAAGLTAGRLRQRRPDVVADDITALAAAAESASGSTMKLRASSEDAEVPLRFVVYRRGAPVPLSAFVPVLESLGLTVIDEVAASVAPADGPAVHLQDFGVAPGRFDIDIGRDGGRVAEAALAVLDGRADADRLNRLVVRSRLSWDDVAVLRAYRRYRLQVGTTFTGEYLDATLVDNPDAARALVDLFNARLDPAAAGDAERLADARVRALAACDAVERLDADRILRGYLGLVEATVRTNRWMRREDGTSRSWLSLKFDSSAVPGMPKPVPHREVFVSSTEMEGVHVRAGAVARGGIRWSDRPDDYRTEILGLMKAQVVKNAVIVPTGAKAASCCAARHRTRRS